MYFVGLATTTHTCSVMTEMKAGMKMMGKYKSKEEAEPGFSTGPFFAFCDNRNWSERFRPVRLDRFRSVLEAIFPILYL
jgi:hypothetical protein